MIRFLESVKLPMGLTVLCAMASLGCKQPVHPGTITKTQGLDGFTAPELYPGRGSEKLPRGLDYANQRPFDNSSDNFTVGILVIPNHDLEMKKKIHGILIQENCNFTTFMARMQSEFPGICGASKNLKIAKNYGKQTIALDWSLNKLESQQKFQCQVFLNRFDSRSLPRFWMHLIGSPGNLARFQVPLYVPWVISKSGEIAVQIFSSNRNSDLEYLTFISKCSSDAKISKRSDWKVAKLSFSSKMNFLNLKAYQTECDSVDSQCPILLEPSAWGAGVCVYSRLPLKEYLKEVHGKVIAFDKWRPTRVSLLGKEVSVDQSNLSLQEPEKDNFPSVLAVEGGSSGASVTVLQPPTYSSDISRVQLSPKVNR